MTAWNDLTHIKRRWKVFKAVKNLEPNATVSAIRDAIEDEFGVIVGADFIQNALKTLMRNGFVKQQDTVWHSTGKPSLMQPCRSSLRAKATANPPP